MGVHGLVVVHHPEPSVDARGQIESRWYQRHHEEMCQADQVMEASVERADGEQC